MIPIYSWQTEQRQMIWNAVNSQYVPETILLTGEKGCGLNAFAMYVAKIVSCGNTKNNNECNECRSCELLNSKSSPNLTVLGDKNEPISIVDVRDVTEQIYHTPIFGNYRFVIVDCVEQLSSSAMNALLKTLEEPPKHVIFILISYHRALVPPTIKSRSKEIYFPTPSSNEVREFLMENNFTENSANMYAYIAHHHPLDAIKLQKEEVLEKFEQFSELIVNIALSNGQLLKTSDIKSYDLLEWLGFLELFLSDVVKLFVRRLDNESRSERYFDAICKVKEIVKRERIFGALSRISELYFTNKILNIKSNKSIIINDINIRLFYQRPG